MTDFPSSPLGVVLSPVQLRVLGSLIEKEITTPEQYPLSLNALVNACNQRSSREPVMDLNQHEVLDALNALDDLELVTPLRDARVAKYEHRIRTVLNLRRDETALLCLLLLRGPQTPGELRSRSDRMFAFDDLAAVGTALERLASRPVAGEGALPRFAGPLTLQLARPPGARESRYIHLLGDASAVPAGGAVTVEPRAAGGLEQRERLETLEQQVRMLQEQVAELAERVGALEARE